MNEKIKKLEQKIKTNLEKKQEYEEKINKINLENKNLEKEIEKLNQLKILNLIKANDIDYKKLKNLIEKNINFQSLQNESQLNNSERSE